MDRMILIRSEIRAIEAERFWGYLPQEQLDRLGILHKELKLLMQVLLSTEE